ncbi:hypothetical protein JKP88DRAFT_272957 [Tribonema minus]|uniref:Homing endonuclease LAGLIDADG domain-containing protein n=1 Tax=Tribonema minus TaxID=303371 RepID=A0A835YWY6_9STRA|nr:hypothetical protein JKP88DRAFT_272957 [Tribonema minus]
MVKAKTAKKTSKRSPTAFQRYMKTNLPKFASDMGFVKGNPKASACQYHDPPAVQFEIASNIFSAAIFGVGVIEKVGEETETSTEKWQWRCRATESIAVANLIQDRLIQKAGVARVLSEMEPVVGFGRNTQHNRDCIVEYNAIKRKFISLDDLDIIARTKGTSVKYADLVNSGLEFREMTVHYIAGFFEAEGSMCLSQNKRSRDDVHNLVVQIAQKDMYILYLILAYMKMGVVNVDASGAGTYVANSGYGIQVLKQLQPFVRSAAIKAQIRIILEEGVNANTKLKLVQYKAKRRAP